jgi:COX assembly protein 2
MHSHLHAATALPCHEIIAALEECHARGFMHKALGNCSNMKREVNRCLGEQRSKNTAKNREKAREKRQGVVSAWKEIDEQS